VPSPLRIPHVGSLSHHFPEEDSNGKKYLPPPKGPRAAQRRYLTHEGVGPGTVYERARSAAQVLRSISMQAPIYRTVTALRLQLSYALLGPLNSYRKRIHR